MKATMTVSRIVRPLAGLLLAAFLVLPTSAARAASTSGTYTVRFDANGGAGTMKAQTIRRGVSKKLRKNAFKRSGGVFVGWAKSRNGAVAYKNRQIVRNLKPAGGSVTLYARWAKATYKVRFKPNGGKGKMAVESFKYGKAKKLSRNRFTRKGYVFAGWAARPKGKVKFPDGKKVKNLTKTGYTIYLYAKWKKVSFKRYCVIDLSAGPNASRYSVTYLSAPPSGGFNKDEYKTTKLVLKRIEAGSFRMGSPEGEKGRWSDEARHKVTLTKPFYIGVFEVTQRQWELVMGTRPSYFSNASCYATRPVEQVSYDDIRGSSKGSRWPASSAVDASSFMGRLRARTGIDFDLPTEAQWEYACRAGTTTTYSYGDSADGNYMWDWDNSSWLTHEVGTKKPNPWGLYDMHGNVVEWCLDWHASSLGGGTDPKGSSSGSHRVERGGNYGNGASGCTSSHRGYSTPSDNGPDDGFRLARTL